MSYAKSVISIAVRASFVLAALTATSLMGGRCQAVTWKTGPEFQRQMGMRLGLTWSQNPLRRALTKLSEDQQVAILLDRRVDPDQKIDFSVDGVPFEEALRRLAFQTRIGVCHVGPVVYFGPPGVTQILPTVAAIRKEEVHRLPPEVRQRLLRLRSWNWDDLSTPRDLIAQLGEDAGLQVLGIERIPHDLWPATELPPLTVVDRLTLLVAGFHLTFRFAPDGTRVRLMPLPEQPVLRRTYPVGTKAKELAAKLDERFPDSSIGNAGNTIVVAGRWEDHQMIQRLLNGQSVTRPTARNGETRYTLNVANQPVGELMEALANKLQRQIQFDPRVTAQLHKRVTFDVKQVSEHELLRAVLDPVGLSYRLNGDTIQVLPGAD